MKEMYFKSDGVKLFCFLKKSCPDNDLEFPPIVVIITGDGEKGLASSTWAPTIDGLSKVGFWVYGFDFLSQGKSDGKRCDLNITTASKNLIDALKHLQKEVKQIEKHTIHFVASSFGASVLCYNLPSIMNISSIVLKSPGLCLYEAYENEVGGIKGLLNWKTSDKNPDSGISFKAYIEALKINLYKNLFEYIGPVLIVYGDKDIIATKQQIERVNAMSKANISTRMLKGVDHSYKQKGAIQKFIDLSVDFFLKHS